MWLVWLIAWIVVDDGYVVPSVGDSLSQFFSLLGTATFWSAFGMTLLRTAYSMAGSRGACRGVRLVQRGIQGGARLHCAVYRRIPNSAHNGDNFDAAHLGVAAGGSLDSHRAHGFSALLRADDGGF